jgi:hypothetical protein
VTWLSTETPPPGGALARIFFETDEVHKWGHYLPIYERILTPLRSQPLRFLEIGVFRGGSLEMWRRYLATDSVIVGVDVDPACARFEDPSRNLYVRIGAQQDVGFLRSVVEEFGPFDVVLDDGSHVTSHQIESFRYLFAKGLADGGIYLVEDLHSNYWKAFRDTRRSFIDLAKDLVELLHAHYPQAGEERRFRQGSPSRKKQFQVPAITTMLEGVEFYDSLIVVRRSRGTRPVPSTILRGAEENQ